MRNNKQRPYKIRLSTGEGNRTVIVHAKDQKSAVAKVKTKGRVLSVRKISFQETFALNDEFVKGIITPDPRLFGFPPKKSS